MNQPRRAASSSRHSRSTIAYCASSHSVSATKAQPGACVALHTWQRGVVAIIAHRRFSHVDKGLPGIALASVFIAPSACPLVSWREMIFFPDQTWNSVQEASNPVGGDAWMRVLSFITKDIRRLLVSLDCCSSWAIVISLLPLNRKASALLFDPFLS